jgi:hypothetical protein
VGSRVTSVGVGMLWAVLRLLSMLILMLIRWPYTL